MKEKWKSFFSEKMQNFRREMAEICLKNDGQTEETFLWEWRNDKARSTTGLLVEDSQLIHIRKASLAEKNLQKFTKKYKIYYKTLQEKTWRIYGITHEFNNFYDNLHENATVGTRL